MVESESLGGSVVKVGEGHVYVKDGVKKVMVKPDDVVLKVADKGVYGSGCTTGKVKSKA